MRTAHAPRRGPLQKVFYRRATGLHRRLRRLLHGLGGCRHGLAALAESPRAGHLRRLDLGKIDLSYESVRALALSSGLNRLAHLHLAHSNLDDRAVKAIAFSTRLPELRALYLGRRRTPGVKIAGPSSSQPTKYYQYIG